MKDEPNIFDLDVPELTGLICLIVALFLCGVFGVVTP